jgi:hypothetical protein
MSFDYVDVTTALLNNPVPAYAGDLVSAAVEGLALDDALALGNPGSSGGDAILQSDTSGLDVTEDPSFIFYVDTPSDDAGGHIEVSEPTIYVPEGFVADDLYAIEFVLDQSTGVLTISLHFSTDPLDHQLAMGTSSDLVGAASTGLVFGSDPGDLSPEQAGPGNGAKCTIVLTKTTTQTSPTSTVTFFFGLMNYSSNSGSSTTTSTKTITVEGNMINGRCVVNGDKN